MLCHACQREPSEMAHENRQCRLPCQQPFMRNICISIYNADSARHPVDTAAVSRLCVAAALMEEPPNMFKTNVTAHVKRMMND